MADGSCWHDQIGLNYRAAFALLREFNAAPGNHAAVAAHRNVPMVFPISADARVNGDNSRNRGNGSYSGSPAENGRRGAAAALPSAVAHTGADAGQLLRTAAAAVTPSATPASAAGTSAAGPRSPLHTMLLSLAAQASPPAAGVIVKVGSVATQASATCAEADTSPAGSRPPGSRLPGAAAQISPADRSNPAAFH